MEFRKLKLNWLILGTAWLGIQCANQKALQPTPSEPRLLAEKQPTELFKQQKAPLQAIQQIQSESRPKHPSQATKKRRASSANNSGANTFVPPNRRGNLNPIRVGEKFTYVIKYLNVKAGNFYTEVLPFEKVGERKVYQLKGMAQSSAIFGLFYKVNDFIESSFDFEGLYSHHFHMVLDESRQQRDSLEVNNSEKQETFFWNRVTYRDQPLKEVKENAPAPAFAQDSLSAIYYLRSLPLEPGSLVAFPVINEGKSWDAECSIVSREPMNTVIGRRLAIKIKVQTRFQGVLRQEQGDSFIWLSDDDRRIPLRVEAKVKVGSVVATLKEAQLGGPS